MGGESAQNIQARFLTKTGGIVLVEGNASCQYRSGKPVASRAIFHDITQRVAAECALEEAKEAAETATAMKSSFLAAASHDLRQPMQSIGLYLSGLEHALRSSPGKAPEIAAKMRGSLATMGELLDALLDISKLDSGSVLPEKQAFRCQTFLERIVNGNIQQANKKGLQLECSSDDCVLHTDPALLGRVIENFVSNAIRHTDKGRVSIDCRSDKGVARISVTDSGIGMKKQDLERVFEEYYQLDNPVRDRHKGLGLGLSIVKHIARLLDHPLAVSSIPGQGSSFAVEVPLGTLEATEQASTAPTKAQPVRGRKIVVLLIDDDPAIVDATTMLLEASGMQVIGVTDGDKALEKIAGGLLPDVVVSDYRLPRYTGVEVIQRIRQATTPDLPTILMTGDTAAPEIRAAALPNCTVLHKPVDSTEFLSVINALSG